MTHMGLPDGLIEPESRQTMELVIAVFKAAGGATLYGESVARSLADGQLKLLDAVTVVKDGAGHARVVDTQEVNAGEGVVWGALSGALAGLLAGPLGALVGVLAGAAVGGIAAEAIDIGVPDAALSAVAERLKPRTSAFLALVEPQYAALMESLLGDLPAGSDTVFFQYTINEAAAQKLKAKRHRKPKHDAE